MKAICTLTFAPVSGWLADRWGRKPTFIAGMLLTVATMYSYSVVTTVEQVYVVRAVDSIAAVALLTTIRTMMADLIAPEMRGFGQGLYSSITQESSTIGSIFGGVLIDSVGYSGAFLAAMACAAVALVVVQWRVPEPCRHAEGGGPTPVH